MLDGISKEFAVVLAFVLFIFGTIPWSFILFFARSLYSKVMENSSLLLVLQGSQNTNAMDFLGKINVLEEKISNFKKEIENVQREIEGIKKRCL